MEKIHVGALTRFNYPIRRNSFPQLICCAEKYSHLKVVNTRNNCGKFQVNLWYLNISLLVGPIFILEY